MSRLILDCSFTLLLRQGPRVYQSNPELTHIPSVTSQLALVGALSLISEAGIMPHPPGIYMSYRDLNSSLHSLITEPSHQLYSAYSCDFLFGDSVGEVKALIPQAFHWEHPRQDVLCIQVAREQTMHTSSGTVIQSAPEPGVSCRLRNVHQIYFIFIGMECDFYTDVQCVY